MKGVLLLLGATLLALCGVCGAAGAASACTGQVIGAACDVDNNWQVVAGDVYRGLVGDSNTEPVLGDAGGTGRVNASGIDASGAITGPARFDDGEADLDPRACADASAVVTELATLVPGGNSSTSDLRGKADFSEAHVFVLGMGLLVFALGRIAGSSAVALVP